MTVIGTGDLGATHAACMAELGHEVLGVSEHEAEVESLRAALAPSYEPGLPEILSRNLGSGRLRFTTDFREAAEFADLHFISVDTTQRKGDFVAKTSRIEDVVARLAPLLARDAVLAGMVAVPVGTANRLQQIVDIEAADGVAVEVVWNPKFRREGFAVAEAFRPDQIVIGLRAPAGSAWTLLNEAYAPILESDPCPVVVTDLATAEVIKVGADVFKTTRIGLASSISKVGEPAGADTTALVDAIGMGPSRGHGYLGVGSGIVGGGLLSETCGSTERAGELGSDPILLSPPDVGETEQRYVLEAMRSGWVAPAGPDLDAFEIEVAERVGAAHAVGLSSGTAALHLALVSWGVGPGDVVPVSTLTFSATVNAIRYVGAEPFFIDCCEETGNMSPVLLQDAMEQLTSAGRSVPAVLPVDMLGKAVDYAAISEIANEFSVRMLCDAAESFGAYWKGRPTGSFGDASVLSFNGNKIMTTSGGGMLLTDDESLATHVRKLSTQAREPVVHYEHTEIGYNYRLSNILAALGRAQLTRLDGMISRRRELRARYRAVFEECVGVRVLGGANDSEDNCWLTAIIVDPAVASFNVNELSKTLTAANIETRPVWKPMHMQPVNKAQDGLIDGTSERLFEQGLTLPSGSALTDEQFERILTEISKVING